MRKIRIAALCLRACVSRTSRSRSMQIRGVLIWIGFGLVRPSTSAV